MVDGARLDAPGVFGCRALRPNGGRVDLGRERYQFTSASENWMVEAFLLQSPSLPGSRPCFFSCGDVGRTRYSLHGDGGGKRLWFHSGADWMSFDFPSGRPSMIDRWVHVAFLFAWYAEPGHEPERFLEVFLDGVSLGKRPAVLGEDPGWPVQIGAADPENGNPWLGLIDELGIHDPAPSQCGSDTNDYDRIIRCHVFAANLGGVGQVPTNHEPLLACSLGFANPAQVTSNLRQADDPNNPRRDLWWNWQAPAEGWVLATAAPVNPNCFEVYLEVREIDAGNPQHQVPIEKNFGSAHYGAGLRSAVLFLARQGSIYQFGVEAGQFTFPETYPEVQCRRDPGTYDCRLEIGVVSPPANDAAVRAEVVQGEFPTVQGSNWGATAEPGDPAGEPGLTGATVWWRWQAPSSREVTLSTRGSDIHTFLAVYELDGAGDRPLLAANSLAPELARATQIEPLQIAQTMPGPSPPFPVSDLLRRTSRVRFQAHQGAEYLIAVDGIRFADGAEGMGDVRLNWEGIALESYEEISATLAQDRSFDVQGRILLVNRGLADSRALRVRMVGTRVKPGTGRTNRDPGEQESVKDGRNLLTVPIGPLRTGNSTNVAVNFTIPAPLGGFTGSAHCWRAGALVEVETAPRTWMPVAYFPLRHGPWPQEEIKVKDGSGPFGGVSGTGVSTYDVYACKLTITAPATLIAGTQTDDIHGTYELLVNGESADELNVDEWLHVRVKAGQGQVVAPRTVKADPNSANTTLVVEGSYDCGGGIPPVTARVEIQVLPALTAPPFLSIQLADPASARITWTAASEVKYRVQYKSRVDAANWIDLEGEVKGQGGEVSKVDPLTRSNRFYRVRLAP